MIDHPINATDDDIALLNRVEQWPNCRSLKQFSEQMLQEITAEHGIDFATALLFSRITRSSTHGELFQMIERLRNSDGNRQLPDDMTVAVVPGAFYREYPHTGAGGDVVLREAARMGFRTELVPTESTGTARENGRLICNWLAYRKGESIILTSLSKGGTDVRMAMSQPNADEHFRNVIGWINVGGILYGSPMVSWILNRSIQTVTYRILFWWFRQRFQFMTSLERRNGGDLDVELTIPKHIKMISVLGFPLRKHLSSRRARRWHKRIGELGPNDSVTLLHDALRLPGHLLPVWGVDHYLQDEWDASGLVRALLYAVATDAVSTSSTDISLAEAPR